MVYEFGGYDFGVKCSLGSAPVVHHVRASQKDYSPSHSWPWIKSDEAPVVEEVLTFYT